MSRQRLAEATIDRGPAFEPIERHGPTYAHDLARHYNQRMTRQDIEWTVDINGNLYLHDKPEWTARRTAELERKAESERQQWLRNNKREVE